MYAYLEGLVADKAANELVIDVGGVGYLLTCSMTTLQNTPAQGERMRVYTYLAVREDALELYGFASREEKQMFLRLTSVTGIGPKSAVAILGSMPLTDLTLAIIMGDVTALSRAPGVGKKTAQRIALELKEQVSASTLDYAPDAQATAAVMRGDAASEALEALQSLGYSAAEAAKAISQVKNQSDRADELVRLALRNMAGM